MRCLILILVLAVGSASSRAQTPDLYDETVLRTLELTFAQSDWWNQLTQNYGTTTDVAADLTVDGVTYPNVGVRFKGNSSYGLTGSSQKKSFNLSIDAFVAGQELYGYDTLNLNNSFQDPTFCREVTYFRLCRDFMPAPLANWVKLIINGENWGVYVNAQQVDKKMIGQWFANNDGNRYKADQELSSATSDGSAMTWLGTGIALYEANYDLKTPNNPAPWTDLIAACDALNNGPPLALDAIFSIDRALWLVALENVFADPDSYIRSGEEYYLYQDTDHGRVNVVQYDGNEAFAASAIGGTFTSVNGRIALNPFWNENDSGRPFLNKLLGDFVLRQRYLAHVRTLVDRWLDWSVIGPIVAQYQALIDAEVAADTKKLYPYSAFISNVTQNYSSGFLSSIAGLQVFVDGRRNFLLGHPEVSLPAPTVSNLGIFPAQPSSTDVVWVTADVQGPSASVGQVFLYYRTLGAYAMQPMFDDGLHMDGAAGDGVFGGSMPPQTTGARVNYYVGAASAIPSGWANTFEPREAEGSPASFLVAPGPSLGPLVLNEFLAINETGIVDEAGQEEDWLEIHNPTAAAVSVGGMYLTDNLADPTRWAIPSPTTIPAGGTLLVWADNDPLDGPYHATFKLSGGGEDIALFRSDGSTLSDRIAFGPQVADISSGRLFDGAGPLVTYTVPTPGALNTAACGVRTYSAQDPTVNTMVLTLTGSGSLGSTITFDVNGGPVSTLHHAAFANLPGHAGLPGTPAVLLVHPSFQTIPVMSDATGHGTYQIGVPSSPSLVGLAFYVQMGAIDGWGQLTGSNAVELIICP